MALPIPTLAGFLVTASTTVILLSIHTAFLNPGIQLRLSQRGIQYASDVATQRLKRDVERLRIPDQAGSDGDVDYRFSNIRIRRFAPPRSRITTRPFKWTLTQTSVDLEANWRYTYDPGLFSVSDSGSLTLSLTMNVDATLDLRRSGNGRATISALGCNSAITNVNVRFSGGASWLYNLFANDAEDAIERSLKGKICDAVIREVNVYAAASLQSLPLKYEYSDTLTLDYSLLQPPILATSYIEFPFKGEFYWTSNREKYPIPPSYIPAQPTTHMVQIWLTEYIMNSFWFARYTNDELVFSLSRTDLDPQYVHILDTSCDNTPTSCLGGMAPNISRFYPNTSIEIDIVTTQPPTTRIDPSGFHGDWNLQLVFNAATPSDPNPFLFSLDIQVGFTIQLNIRGTKLTIKTDEVYIDMALAESGVGFVYMDRLNWMKEFLVRNVVVSELDKQGEEGIPLPMVKDVDFTNTVLELMPGCVHIATDLVYTGN